MKKWLIGSVIVVMIAVSFNIASDQYRYEFYDWAIGFEASQANLVKKTGELNNEKFAYFEGPKVTGQQSVILLHGFGASKENWLRFAAYLTDKYHVVALDLSGHGDNVRDMNKSYKVEDQVGFVHAVSEVLGLKAFHLVGNSMGGAISSLYSASYPQRVLSAVLISPAGVHDIPSKMDEILETGDNPLIAKTNEGFEQLLEFVMEDKPYIPGAVLKVEAEKAVSRVAINQKIFADLRSDLESGMEQRLKQIKAPVLIIWGREDRAINVENIDKYAQLIPNAKKLVLEQVGHLAMIEVPDVSAQAMLDFIGEG